MATLEKRIAALERTEPRHHAMTIIHTIVDPGNAHPDCNFIEAGAQQWTRQPGESESDFINRASREVVRDKPGIAQLVASEVNHANH